MSPILASRNRGPEGSPGDASQPIGTHGRPALRRNHAIPITEGAEYVMSFSFLFLTQSYCSEYSLRPCRPFLASESSGVIWTMGQFRPR